MLQEIGKITDGLQGLIDPINILVTNADKGKNMEIANLLIDKGYTVQEVQDFIDVSRPQMDPILLKRRVRFEVKAEMEAEAKAS